MMNDTTMLTVHPWLSPGGRHARLFQGLCVSVIPDCTKLCTLVVVKIVAKNSDHVLDSNYQYSMLWSSKYDFTPSIMT